jgi:hypothetical protein
MSVTDGSWYPYRFGQVETHIVQWLGAIVPRAGSILVLQPGRQDVCIKTSMATTVASRQLVCALYTILKGFTQLPAAYGWPTGVQLNTLQVHGTSGR